MVGAAALRLLRSERGGEWTARRPRGPGVWVRWVCPLAAVVLAVGCSPRCMGAVYGEAGGGRVVVKLTRLGCGARRGVRGGSNRMGSRPTAPVAVESVRYDACRVALFASPSR